jgi:hypothetical protein
MLPARQPDLINMTAKIVVRDYQRALARLVNDHERALTRLANAEGRREQAIAAHGEKVAAAKRGVDQTVATMAGELGAELTASLLDLDVRDVRRLVRTNVAKGD